MYTSKQDLTTIMHLIVTQCAFLKHISYLNQLVTFLQQIHNVQLARKYLTYGKERVHFVKMSNLEKI